MLLNANGVPLQTEDAQAKEASIRKQVAADLAAFAEWQKQQYEGKGLIQPSLDAIGRACILAVFRSLPIGIDGPFLQQSLDQLMSEATRIEQAKQAEARIRASLAANNEQAGPS